jgi:hypothetical protein
MRGLLWASVTMLPLLLIGASAQGYGDTTQTVIMNNNTGHYIQYEFTDDNDHSLGWPGSNNAYELPPHGSERRELNCYQGQKMCYGAWVRGDDGQFWGAGNNNSQSCTNCCFHCVGDTVRYNLNE